MQEASRLRAITPVRALRSSGAATWWLADAGWPGLVLKVAISGIERRSSDDGKTLFDVGGGEPWDKFVAHAVMQHCAGVEC